MSSGPFLAYGGFRAHVGSVTIPFTGTWSADLQFADTDPVPDTGELTCGDLTLFGSIYRQAVFAGHRSARLVGGYGGWRKKATSKSYTLTGGVSLALVVGDLAREVGEKVSVTSNHVIGDYFLRESEVAQRILQQLAGNDWYMGEDGVTRFGARASAAVSGDFLVNHYDGALGKFVVSTESYAEWIPGNTFENALVTETQTISSMRIDSDNTGTLRHTVLSSGPEPETDRMISALRELIRAEFPKLKFMGVYGYTVLESDGDTVTARPINAALSLPPVVKIPLRVGVAGMRCTPSSGTRVAVGFLDGEPTQPFVLGGFDEPSSARAVVCYDDIVTVGTQTSAIAGAAKLTRKVQVEFP